MGNWKTGGIWLVGYEAGKWWCSNRGQTIPALSTADTYENALESAHKEAVLLMMKHPIKRDMSQARIVYPIGMMGMGVLSAPEYIDYETTHPIPDKVWVIEAPTRYQALKIALKDLESAAYPLISVTGPNSLNIGNSGPLE